MPIHPGVPASREGPRPSLCDLNLCRGALALPTWCADAVPPRWCFGDVGA
jgi:hypothetical protein